MSEYIDWNDESVPIGKRKVAFVKWLMQKRKVSMVQAKSMANSKFGKCLSNSSSNRSD